MLTLASKAKGNTLLAKIQSNVQENSISKEENNDTGSAPDIPEDETQVEFVFSNLFDLDKSSFIFFIQFFRKTPRKQKLNHFQSQPKPL